MTYQCSAPNSCSNIREHVTGVRGFEVFVVVSEGYQFENSRQDSQDNENSLIHKSEVEKRCYGPINFEKLTPPRRNIASKESLLCWFNVVIIFSFIYIQN